MKDDNTICQQIYAFGEEASYPPYTRVEMLISWENMINQLYDIDETIKRINIEKDEIDFN